MKQFISLTFVCLFSTTIFGQQNQSEKIRIAVQSGYSYRLAKVSDNVPPEYKGYVKSLKSGYNIGLDAAFFITPEFGLGLKYSRFGSSGTFKDVRATSGDDVIFGKKFTDDISINFYAASYTSQWVIGNGRSSILGILGLGYLGYKDEGEIVGQIVKQTGGTFGASVDLGYDYALSNRISIGAGIGLVTGTLSKIKTERNGVSTTAEPNDENKENLTRLDINAGIRFRI